MTVVWFHRRSDLAPSGSLFMIRLRGEGHIGTFSLAAATVALVMTCIAGCGGQEVPSSDAQSAELANGPAAVAPEKTPPAQPTVENLKRYPNENYNASIVQILAHRDRYHGNEVQIKGYLLVRFEGTAIYLSKEDADYGMTRNGFWVDFNKRAVPYEGIVGPTQYDRKYVLIEGTFDKDRMGHMSAYQGTIKNVTRVYELTKND